MRSALPFFLALAFASGCAASEPSTPRIRVARHLGCEADRTRVERLEPRAGRHGAWQVTGCGKTAVYVCTEPVKDCWRQGDVYPEGTSFTAR